MRDNDSDSIAANKLRETNGLMELIVCQQLERENAAQLTNLSRRFVGLPGLMAKQKRFVKQNTQK